MLYNCIFSNKFDLNQAICVSHIRITSQLFYPCASVACQLPFKLVLVATKKKK